MSPDAEEGADDTLRIDPCSVPSLDLSLPLSFLRLSLDRALILVPFEPPFVDLCGTPFFISFTEFLLECEDGTRGYIGPQMKRASPEELSNPRWPKQAGAVFFGLAARNQIRNAR